MLVPLVVRLQFDAVVLAILLSGFDSTDGSRDPLAKAIGSFVGLAPTGLALEVLQEVTRDSTWISGLLSSALVVGPP